jgi:outer membrane protein OmpU
VTHAIGGVTASFGAFTGKAIYGVADGDIDDDQWAVSGDYTFGATTLTAYYNNVFGDDTWGVGAAYDLGGGASLVAGYAADEEADDDAYDFGISFTF